MQLKHDLVRRAIAQVELLFLHLILLLRFFRNYKKPSEHFRFVECMIWVHFTVAFLLCTIKSY